MNKKTFNRVAIIAFLFGLILAAGFFAYNTMLNPMTKEEEVVVFVVNPNDNLTTITNNLEDQAIIKSASMLKLYGRLSKTSSFVEGNFNLDKSLNAREILIHLTKGDNVVLNEVTITLQEGLWAKDIAEKISAKVDVSKEELINLWNDADYIELLMNDYPFLTKDVLSDVLKVKLEGYLAPNTYNFFIDTDADAITRKLLDQTLIVYEKYQAEFAASKYSIHEIFSLASLTQYESGNFEDDQIIAGIWYNRLDIGWRLESSAAVCYALYDFDSWEECEKNTDFDSPYNNYIYYGIMPGPVTNPGEFAIKATLKPKKTNYFFFMADAKGDKTIYYSETYEEHAKKVNKYLR
ncbi:MAG: endolytic transglycosylase MltG [Erysipelothrix sp.]|nr:endolytic transglycosylase MltG [Erysipelothrix sp.]